MSPRLASRIYVQLFAGAGGCCDAIEPTDEEERAGPRVERLPTAPRAESGWPKGQHSDTVQLLPKVYLCMQNLRQDSAVGASVLKPHRPRPEPQNDLVWCHRPI